MSKKTDIFQPELLDELLKNCNSPGDVIGQGGLFKQLQKALLERVMDAGLTSELGYEKRHSQGNNSGNSRNGTSKKAVRSESGDIDINVPRDRNGDYSPKILPKNQRQLAGIVPPRIRAPN